MDCLVELFSNTRSLSLFYTVREGESISVKDIRACVLCVCLGMPVSGLWGLPFSVDDFYIRMCDFPASSLPNM